MRLSTTTARLAPQATPAPQAPQTLAAQWAEHAARHLPADASAAEVRRQERAWYRAKLEELEAAPRTRENVELLCEAAGWARLSIGRRAA